MQHREIWDRLGEYYGMNALDELEEEDKEEEEEEEQQHGDDRHREFSLPSTYDNDQAMSDHRQDDTTRENSPAIERPPSRRTRTSRRDVSPAVTESSVASTPEPDEGKATPTSTSSTSRRTGRSSTRKSEAGTPEPGTTRGSGSSSSSAAASNRRSNRATSSSSRSTTTTTRRQSKRK
ncbi:unnamed protein product [Absidia cylindrospora]